MIEARVTGMVKETVFFFAYSWSEDKRLDAYQQALLNEFLECGYNVRVYLANHLVRLNVQFGVNPRAEKFVIADIKKYRPSLILSMNQGLLSHDLCDVAKSFSRIVTWIVDHPSHIFYPNINSRGLGSKIENVIHPAVEVIVSSSQILRDFQKSCKGLKEKNLHFLSSVSNFKKFSLHPRSHQRNIVFIGSYLETSEAEKILAESSEEPEEFSVIKNLLVEIETRQSGSEFISENRKKLSICMSRHKLNEVQLEQIMTNLVSSNIRRRAVTLLKDLGMEVFGNASWIKGLSGDIGALGCYQTKRVSTLDDIIDLYQSSKIAIQIPQVQVGPALSYRVFDILSSGALLIHPYNEGSDLFYFFGKDCPVPTFKSLEELRSLCQYYLENESERLDLVERCNRLVADGYSFKDRVEFLLNKNKSEMVSAPEPVRAEFINTNIMISRPYFASKPAQKLVSISKKIYVSCRQLV